MELKEKKYTGGATSRGGRSGTVTTANPQNEYKLAVPEGMGGAGGDGPNPEQLFGAAYAACFESAVRAHARAKKLDPGMMSVTAEVSFGKDADGKHALAVSIQGDMPNLTSEQADELMKAAHQSCPYSRALRGEASVTLASR